MALSLSSPSSLLKLLIFALHPIFVSYVLILQSIFTHARQKLQAGEELLSAQSAVPEPEVESEKEAGSDGEDEDDEVCETARKSVVTSGFSSMLYPTRFKLT